MSGLQPGIIVKPPVHVRATVTPHILEGMALEHGANGYVARLAFGVTDITGGGADILVNAMNARGIPYWGQSHPTIIGLPVARRTARLEPDSQRKVRVEVVYEYPSGGGNFYINDPDDLGPGSASIEYSNTVQAATTETDYLNELLYVAPYTYTPPGAAAPVTTDARVAKVEMQQPAPIVRYRRRERYAPASEQASPSFKSALYTGAINSAETFRDDPHFWMCTGITGVSDDGGRSYNVNYEFQYNPNSWDIEIGPHDAKGEPIQGAPTEKRQLYKEIDFWNLNLTV